ncbi:MAG: ABC transporter ATP-binding protein [Planctomycetaceae bacterium]|nr:ABC transporter ATP-binding protein [Planctomycetaceae bacterium]
MSEFVIAVDDLRKTYRSGFLGRRKFEALKGVSLNVPAGSIYGLLGPNGAGKTTLIKILLGIVRRTGGMASVLGIPAGSRGAREQVGYLPENHRIPSHLTGYTALEFYGGLSGLSPLEVRGRRDQLLDQVGLSGRGKDSVSGYSKGMLQRLGLAQAMLHRPRLIILDEPTDGVDPVGRREIRDVLKRLAAEGHSIFLNSHLLQEIELVCDRAAILLKGTLLREGTVEELRNTMEEQNSLYHLQLTGPANVIQQFFAARAATQIRQVRQDAFEVMTSLASQAEVDQLIDELRGSHISIHRLARPEQTLEDAFIRIVGAQK